MIYLFMLTTEKVRVLAQNCLEFQKRGMLTIEGLNNLLNVFELLTPAEIFYVLVQDLKLFSTLTELNQSLQQTSTHVAPSQPIKHDLSYLKLDPMVGLRKEYHPEEVHNMGFFTTKNTSYFSHMLPHNLQMSEVYGTIQKK
jgi:hypothetical protein